MNIRICEDPACADIEVVVRCRQLDDTVLSLLARLRVYDAKLTGERDGATYVLAAADVLYADTADKKTFLYTADAVYETPLRLYELQVAQLAARDFVRAGKSVLLNFAHVAALRPDFGGRMRVTMSNGEVVVASRQYVPALKAKSGAVSPIPQKECLPAKKFFDIVMPVKTAACYIFTATMCVYAVLDLVFGWGGLPDNLPVFVSAAVAGGRRAADRRVYRACYQKAALYAAAVRICSAVSGGAFGHCRRVRLAARSAAGHMGAVFPDFPGGASDNDAGVRIVLPHQRQKIRRPAGPVPRFPYTG